METRVRVFEKKKKGKCFLEHSDECKRRGEGIPIWYFDPLDPGLSFIQIHSSDTGGYPVARYGQSDPDTRCALPLLPFARPAISYALSMKLIILKFSLLGWIPGWTRERSTFSLFKYFWYYIKNGWNNEKRIIADRVISREIAVFVSGYTLDLRNSSNILFFKSNRETSDDWLMVLNRFLGDRMPLLRYLLELFVQDFHWRPIINS